MRVHEIHAKSLLRKQKKIDSWFISQYGMNLYRGCAHNCIYCDGRAEKYQVSGEFGQDIDVKINALELLKKEMSLKRRQKFYQHGFIMIGGGVGDSYQPVERQYQLTRKTLEFISSVSLPIHILTKSTLVERDVDLLTEINKKSHVLLSFSFSSTNNKICQIFEPGVPAPSDRLACIKRLKKLGFSCGVFLMPVIPFITDTPSVLQQTIQDFHEMGIDYIIFSGMTLKTGRQQDYFYQILQKHYPGLMNSYPQIYKGSCWGNATGAYYKSIHETFHEIIKQYPLPIRIPLNLFTDIVTDDVRVIIILEHMDYLLKMKGQKSPFGYAAYQLSQQHRPLSVLKKQLKTIKGIGPVTERIIQEILKTRTCTYYEQLMNG
jgi:DNA repair photolyase